MHGKLRVFFFPVLFLLAGSPVVSENLLFHVKTALDQDDAQICVAPNVALAALEAGDTVTLLFDASAVTSITRGWGWFRFGERTPMDAAALPERERLSLAQQFGLPVEETPANYGDYLHFLTQRGGQLFVNSTMLVLYNIDPKDVDPIVKPVELKQMLDLFKRANKILVY